MTIALRETLSRSHRTAKRKWAGRGALINALGLEPGHRATPASPTTTLPAHPLGKPKSSTPNGSCSAWTADGGPKVIRLSAREVHPASGMTGQSHGGT